MYMWYNVCHLTKYGCNILSAGFYSQDYRTMAASSQMPPPLHLRADATLTQQGMGEWHTHTHTGHMKFSWLFICVFLLFFLHHVILQLCYGGELLLSPPPSAAPSTLSSSLYSVLPAGGAGGNWVLGAHPPTQQTAWPIAAQLPGSAGVSTKHTK